MLYFANSHPIVTSSSRVSHAPPHRTLSAFLNRHCIIIKVKNKKNVFKTFYKKFNTKKGWLKSLESSRVFSYFLLKSQFNTVRSLHVKTVP